MKQDSRGEKVTLTACASHCGGACLLKVHTRDGIITRIETDDGGEPQLRACLRCRAYRQRVYDPGRLQYPMKRTGERGEGKFERISWDEALDTIVRELDRVRESYGPAAVFFLPGGGDHAHLHTPFQLMELLAMTGGLTAPWGIHSFEGGLFASMATYGTLSSGNSFDDLLNSRLIIMWGWDPAVTIHETNTTWYLVRAHEAGTRIISVDPRYTDSTAVLADRWIPIIPGTDGAMLVAMAHVMVRDDLHDKKFLDTYTVGFEQFRDYILGKNDGTPKTPQWAENITGVPAATIENLAREYATTRPAALIGGIAPGRTAYGEQYHRLTKTLAAMTGNIGVHGGWTGRSLVQRPQFGGFDFRLRGLPHGKNPVETAAPPRRGAIATMMGSDNSARIHTATLADALLKGKAGGYPADVRMLFIMHTNPINQEPNTNKIAQAFQQMEFIAVAEQVMTATARYADILLPVGTYLERNDIVAQGAIPWYGYVRQVIPPLYESRSPLEICQGLAERLGVTVYHEKTEDGWLRALVKESRVPDYDKFKEEAACRLPFPERVAFRPQIEDPANHPFPTPSGKIEIYSRRIADMDNPDIPPIPEYREAWEGRHDPLAVKYPLQLITSHMRRRAHSQFEAMPWLREITGQALAMNPEDAAARGIGDGDDVRVFNDRGEMIIPVRVTGRIMPGVVDLPQGAWYRPDENGVDRGGCANVLTRDAHSPAGAYCYNTNLVQVAKADSA
ncbi:MAG: molybdopterin-dependent oxidoreductase [Chloroflexota bacterium]